MSGEVNVASNAGAMLRDVLKAGEAFNDAASVNPTVGSQADLEINHHSEAGADGSPWSVQDARSPYDVSAGLLLFGAGQYLASLSQLFVSEMALFGFQAVARSLVEATSRAWWILAPEIGIRERVARGFIERWYSLEQLAKVDVAAGRPAVEHDARALKLRADAARLGLDERLNSKLRVIGFQGLIRPESTALTTEFLGSFGGINGEFWYRFISGVTHSALYGLMEYTDTSSPDPATGLLRLVPRLPAEGVVNIAVLAVTVYLGTIERHALLFGRNTTVIEDLRRSVCRALLESATGNNQAEHLSFPPFWIADV